MYTIQSPKDLGDLPDNALAIGGGSNLIISPSISFPLIKVSPTFCQIEMDDNVLVCSAGVSVSSLIRWMLQRNVCGIEFAAGVPATIGGMVYMNFECWGQGIADLIDSVYIYEPNKGCRWIKKNEYAVSYRWTSFHDMHCIILAVRLQVRPSPSNITSSQIKQNIDRRKKHQPILKSTFGSVFKNPPQKKAWQLVDGCQLKGASIGDACVSFVHANFFENKANATFSDTLALIHHIQNTVYKMYNVKLECEVQIIQ